MTILIFKTNLRSAEDVKKVAVLLNGDARIPCWSVDRDDCDCVLRIEALGLESGDVIDWVRRAGFECAELDG